MKLTVVGGSYWESCAFPNSREFYGSGLRAALAFAKLVSTEFHTIVGADTLPLLQSIAATRGVELKIAQGPATFAFEYLHGLAVPVYYPSEKLEYPRLRVEGDVVLAFGMMEGNSVIHGKTVVYDPQAPNSPMPFESNGSTAERLAIVCNQTEARNLAGHDDLLEAGRKLLQNAAVEVVVIKHGAKGAMVFIQGKTDAIEVPAFLLKPRSLIGSGDIFSAAFTYHWALKNCNPVEAARLASKAAAYYCATLVLPIDPLAVEESNPKEARAMEKRVYLAGPFFSPAQLWMIEEMRRCLLGQGLKVFSPYHDVGLGEPHDVAPQDIEALEKCDLVVAVLDGQDAGTLFEVGYARALKKRVITYHADEHKKHLTMPIGSDCDVYDNLVAAVYSAAWE